MMDKAAAAPSPGIKDSFAGAEDDDDDSEDVPTSNEVNEEDGDDYDDEEEVASGIKHRGSHIYINRRRTHCCT